MLTIRNFYIVMAVLGTLVPWYFFGQFIAENGINIEDFVRALFVNGAAAGFTSDILLTATIFWVWSYRDAKGAGIKSWWLVIPATFFVGLSLALPMYLAIRANAKSDQPVSS